MAQETHAGEDSRHPDLTQPDHTMVFVRSTGVGFVAALTLLSGRAFASSDSSSSVCIDTFISDGDCDLVNDIAECGRWRR